MVIKAFSNDGDSPKWVAGRMILPGATELIDVPPDADDEPALVAVVVAEDGALQGALLAELLEKAVKDIVPQLAGMSEEDLLALEELEKAGKARKGLLAEVLQERLARAVGGDGQALDAGTGEQVPADAAPADETVNRDADPAEGGSA